MGNGCCKQEEELNPDGNKKEPQTKEQAKGDPAELRQWAKNGDSVELERLLKRMPVRDIQSGAKRSEGASEEEDHTALHFAAASGFLPCVELLVLYGAAVNARGAGGAAPLHCALESGRRDVANFLLEHGADINARNKGGASPFLSVVLSGRKRLTVWLLQRCTSTLDVGSTDRNGLGPCTVAARHGWWDLLERLVGMVANLETALNTRSSQGETPLGWLLKYGAAGMLEGPELERLVGLLLDKGASAVVPVFQEQIPPLCLAAATGNNNVISAIRDRGAVLDPSVTKDSVQRNILHYAAAKGRLEMCEWIAKEVQLQQERLEQEWQQKQQEQPDKQLPPLPPAPKLDVPDAGGNTPLHLASVRGHGEVARSLLEKVEDLAAAVMATNKEGICTYHLALQAGPEERAQQGALWLLEKIGEEGSKKVIQVKDKVLETPLLLAVGSHQEKVVERLLAMGHDSDEANWVGETPISRCLAGATHSTAVADGVIFRLLVDKGAKMENASGSSHPLLAICMNPLSKFSEQVVKMLTERAGGDTSALKWDEHKDAGGRGPLHLAALYDNAFMVKYLLGVAKMDVEARCGSGLTPLMYAAMGSSTNAIRVLLNRRADPRVTDPAGRSTLSYCLTLDRLESLACAAMLLVMGCPPDDSVDLRGEGLLHRAVRYGTSEFIRLWSRYGGNLCLLATTEDTADDLPEEVSQLQLPQPAPQPMEGQSQGEQATGRGGAEEGAREGATNQPKVSTRLSTGPSAASAAAAVAAAAEARRRRAEGDYLDTAPQPLEAEEEEDEGGEGGKEEMGSIKEKTEGGQTAVVMKGAGQEGCEAGDDDEDSASAVAAADAASDSGLAKYGGSGGANDASPMSPAEPALESFSVPTGVAYGGGSVKGAVAEAVEALETEVARYPSFCRQPSALEVRRWARWGAAWFDDALPSVTQLESDSCPPPLPLPPGDVEEEAEEAALAAEAAPTIHPALDADAIWRRMLLDRMKDRRQPAAVVAVKATDRAAQHRASSSGARGVAEARLSISSSGTAGATEADSRALNAPHGNACIHRNGSASGVPSGCRVSSDAADSDGGLQWTPSVQSARASGSHISPYRTSSTATNTATAEIGAMDDWMDEIVRTAEATLQELQRGAPSLACTTAAEVYGASYGSGSRAVRAISRSRHSLFSLGLRGPRAVAEAQEEGEGGAAGLSSAVSAAGTGISGAGGAKSGEDDDAESLDSDNCAEGDGGNGGDGTGKGGAGGDGDNNGGDGQQGFATLSGKLDTAAADAKDAAMGVASKLLDKRISINDPYYRIPTRYKGVPRYMDERVVNVEPVPLDELTALADELADRLGCYPDPVDEPQITGADLRERNIEWYNRSLSPGEYPMKPGQWKSAIKKAKAAAQAARKRTARKPGEKVVVRARKVWFGLPAMPSRPELRGTSALVYAVRLVRPACVAALMSASLQPLNRPDGWGHSPVAYAAYLLARDKHNAVLKQMYDMLLEKLPQVNFTRLDPDDGSRGHSLLCPINLAVITGDSARLAHLVLRCAGAVNDAWTALPDIPTYLQGTWEKHAAKCDSRCPPLALAVLSKRIDTVKLVLDLGANPNLFGEPRDVRLKAKLAREYEEEQRLAEQLASDYTGIVHKTKAGIMQRISRIKRALANIEIPGITKPHPFVTPLHLAGRTGQAEVAFLLLRRGAMANGAGAVPYAKKTPLQEALMYARSNFLTTNPAARRKNWKAVRPAIEDIPAMSPEAVKKETDSRASALMRAMVDPTVMAIKAVALAAKYAVNFLLEMRKRPIAHWDPALATAHVLLSFRAPYDLTDTQTNILLRDLVDNGKWRWLRRPCAPPFRVDDPVWTQTARGDINTAKLEADTGYAPMAATPDPKVYKSLKQKFVAGADEAYFGAGSAAMYERYQACSQERLEELKQYLNDVLQPTIQDVAGKAVRFHVEGTAAQLERLAASRRKEHEEAAASLERGVALEEEDVMEGLAYKRFVPPTAAAPAGGATTAVAPAAQAAAAEQLRASAAAVSSQECWGKVAVWRSGGEFVGNPDDTSLESLPRSDDEIAKLSKALAGVDTDALKESLANLQEQLSFDVGRLLAKMQDAQEGFSSLLEAIGIDFLDIL